MSQSAAVKHLISLLSGYKRIGRHIQLNPQAINDIRITMNKLYPTECLIVKIKNDTSYKVVCAACLTSTAVIIDFGAEIRNNFPRIGGKNVTDVQLWYDGDVVTFTENPTKFITCGYLNPLLGNIIADIKVDYPTNELAMMLPRVASLPVKSLKSKPLVEPLVSTNADSTIAIDIQKLMDEFIPNIGIKITEEEIAEIDEIYYKLGNDEPTIDKSNCVIA